MQSRDTVSRNPRYRPFRAACSGPEFGAPFVASRCCAAAEQFRGRTRPKGSGQAGIFFWPQSTIAGRRGLGGGGERPPRGWETPPPPAPPAGARGVSRGGGGRVVRTRGQRGG